MDLVLVPIPVLLYEPLCSMLFDRRHISDDLGGFSGVYSNVVVKVDSE